jgi:hypothetical protein
MADEKETDKGLMHNFFGAELCEGCKGLLVVAYITPSPRDISSFAASFAKQQKLIDEAGHQLAQTAMTGAKATARSNGGQAGSNPKRRSKKQR